MLESRSAKGAVLMVAASVGFCAMSGLVRYASDIDIYQVTFFRFVIGLGLLGTAALFGKIKLTFRHRPFLFFRGLAGGVSVFLFFLSIQKLGVAKATIIFYLFPIFGSIYSAIFLKEKISIRGAAAIAAAFVGIYLLAGNGEAGSLWGAFGKYEMLAVLGAMLAGVAVVLIKKLHDTDSSYAIFFAQCAVGMWLLIVPASVRTCVIGYSGVVVLLGIGVTAAVSQLLMTKGYDYLSVMTGSLLGMLAPALSYLVGMMVFSEAISVRSVVGSVIVLGSCAVVLSGKNKV